MNISDRLSAEQKKLIAEWTEKSESIPAGKIKEEKIPGLTPPPGKKNAKPLESILFMIREDIENARTLERAQKIIDEFIETYQITKDRARNEYLALISIRNNTRYDKMISHMYSSILKFNGLGSPDAQRNRNRYK